MVMLPQVPAQQIEPERPGCAILLVRYQHSTLHRLASNEGVVFGLMVLALTTRPGVPARVISGK